MATTKTITATRTATASTNHYVVTVDGETIAEFNAVHEYAYVVVSTHSELKLGGKSYVPLKTASLTAAQRKAAKQVAVCGPKDPGEFTSTVVAVQAA